MIQSIDEKLACLELPIAPAELYQVLDKLTDNCDAYDFVADQGAQKARECWIACQFLVVHGKRTGQDYEVTDLLLDETAPDIRYREVTQARRDLFVEAAELLSPGRKRSREYLRRKQQRRACERAGRGDRLLATAVPDEDVDVEAERRAFPCVASKILADKLQKDYGSNCTLVLYVNLGLYGDEPIQNFVATYTPPKSVRFDEIWFFYRGEIIPLLPRASTR